MRVLDFLAEQRVRLHSLVVVRHGNVILDAYWWPFAPTDAHDIASCTIENGTIALAFAGDSLQVSISERTMFGTVGEFPGRPFQGEAPKGDAR